MKFAVMPVVFVFVFAFSELSAVECVNATEKTQGIGCSLCKAAASVAIKAGSGAACDAEICASEPEACPLAIMLCKMIFKISCKEGDCAQIACANMGLDEQDGCKFPRPPPEHGCQ